MPFGAVIVDRAGTVVVEAENVAVTDRDWTGHAEVHAVRLASRQLDAEAFIGCTLYASTEPCAMCSGAIYWANVRRVVFALSEEEWRRIALAANPMNATLNISCRDVFAHGTHEVEVRGPLLEGDARAVHEGFWA